MSLGKGEKRTEGQREADFVTIAEMYCAGKSQHAMAAAVGISQNHVSRELMVLRERWLVRSTTAVGIHVAEQLAKLDRLEAQYQEAWERSCQQQTKTKTSRTTLTVVNPSGVRPERDQAQVEQSARDGNPAFLAGVLSVIAERSKLLGLYPAEPAAPPVQVNIQVNGVAWEDI